MKRKVIICLSVIAILIISIVVILFNNKSTSPFYLENNYYGKNNMTEIKMDELNHLIDKKESFAIFIYQPMCVISSDFEKILLDFLEDNKISIYKIAFSNIKRTSIGKLIKHYPSFIIYSNGKMIDFLEADKDEDVEYYSSKDGFERWFTKYVNLRNNF